MRRRLGRSRNSSPSFPGRTFWSRPAFSLLKNSWKPLYMASASVYILHFYKKSHPTLLLPPGSNSFFQSSIIFHIQSPLIVSLPSLYLLWPRDLPASKAPDTSVDIRTHTLGWPQWFVSWSSWAPVFKGTSPVAYYSATKRTETYHRMNLETSCHIKESRHKRPHVVCSHLYEMSGKGKSIETERRVAFLRGWGGRMGSDCLWEQSLFFVWWNVPELGRGTGCTTLWMC